MSGWPLPNAPVLKDRLRKFIPVRSLDTTGPASIYLATDTTGASVTVRFLEYGAEPAGSERDAYHQTLVRSGLTLDRLRHENIIRLIDFGAVEDGVFLVVEHLPGGSLRQRFSALSGIPTEEMIAILGGAASALDYCHGAGIVHCDVQPSHILLDGRGGCRLANFTSARPKNAARITMNVPLPPSVVYAAPELLRGKVSAMSDQFSLAAAAYRGLTGARPFPAHTMESLICQIMAGNYPSPCRARPDLPASVDAVFARAMSPEPYERFASCTEFVDELGAKLAGGRFSAIRRRLTGLFSSAR